MGEKAFLLFKIEEKNYFWISLTPDKLLSSPIKIHRQLSPVNLNVNNWTKETCTRLTRTVLDRWFLSLVTFCCWPGVVGKPSFSSSSCLDENAKKNFLSVFVFVEAEEVKIWWNWGIQCGMSFAQPWVVLQPRWMRILSLDFSVVCRQWTLTGYVWRPACLFHLKIFPVWLLEARL